MVECLEELRYADQRSADEKPKTCAHRVTVSSFNGGYLLAFVKKLLLWAYWYIDNSCHTIMIVEVANKNLRRSGHARSVRHARRLSNE